MKRGFTIAELLTVAFLSLVVLWLVAQILWPATMMFRREQAISDCHQSALVLIQRLHLEISNASLDSVTIYADPASNLPAGISFQPIEGFGPTGEPVFAAQMVCIYLIADQQRVVRGTWTPGSAPLGAIGGPDPLCLSNDQLRLLCQWDSARPMAGRVLARNIQTFQLFDSDDDPDSAADDNLAQFTPPLGVRVQARALVHNRGNSPHYADVWLEDRVTPRNVRW